MTLTEIQQLTEAFSAQHRALSIVIQTVETELAAVRKRYLRRIMDHVALTAARKAELLAALEKSSDLFDKPRTRVFDGIKVGYRKLEGKIVIQDEVQTIGKILDTFDNVDAYLKLEYAPIKEGLQTLDADTLKKLGVQVTADTDVVVIKPLDGELEKLVAALLDQAADQSQEASRCIGIGKSPGEAIQSAIEELKRDLDQAEQLQQLAPAPIL